jgi:Zn finger protein HypA/HybF involved in hydrogenase expression
MSDDDAEEEAFEARYNARRQRMLSQPPRCLAPFAVALAAARDLPGVSFDGHGEPDESIFRVRCPCGGESFRLRGTFYAKDFRGDPLNFFSDPLELICESCARDQLLFDADKDGYNAEIEAAEDLTRPKSRSNEPEPPRTEYGCSKCGGRAMHIWTRFEHSAETCEDSFAEDLSEGREQDFFSWFTLVGRCNKCRALQTVSDFECA